MQSIAAEDMTVSRGGQVHIILVAVVILGGRSMPFHIANRLMGQTASPRARMNSLDRLWALLSEIKCNGTKLKVSSARSSTDSLLEGCRFIPALGVE